jgi:hypothetical protein
MNIPHKKVEEYYGVRSTLEAFYAFYRFDLNFQIEGLAQKFTMFQCLKLHC